MSSDSTIISIFSTITGIIKSKKKRHDIVKAVFANTKKPFEKSQASISLKHIKEDVMVMKIYIYLLISVIFLLIAHSEINSAFSVYNIYEIISKFSIYYGMTTFIFFLVLFATGNILKNSNFDAKIQSYWFYILIKSLYLTTSDWLFMFLSYLFFGLLIYNISPKLNTDYLLLIPIIKSIIFYSGIFFLTQISIFMFLKFVIEDIRPFEDLESVTFKDVRESIEIRVWAGGTAYEGRIRDIGEDLVISSADHKIRIRWDSIQAFEVIVPKQKQSSMEKSYFM